MQIDWLIISVIHSGPVTFVICCHFFVAHLDTISPIVLSFYIYSFQNIFFSLPFYIWRLLRLGVPI